MTLKQKLEIKKLLDEHLDKKTIDDCTAEIDDMMHNFKEQMSKAFLRKLCHNLFSKAKDIQHRAFWYRFMKLNRLKENDSLYLDKIISTNKELGMLVDVLGVDTNNVIESYILPTEGTMCEAVVRNIII